MSFVLPGSVWRSTAPSPRSRRRSGLSSKSRSAKGSRSKSAPTNAEVAGRTSERLTRIHERPGRPALQVGLAANILAVPSRHGLFTVAAAGLQDDRIRELVAV